MEKVLLITPTYNEAENIQKFINSTKKFKELHLLVVDDNSPDGTATTEGSPQEMETHGGCDVS